MTDVNILFIVKLVLAVLAVVINFLIILPQIELPKTNRLQTIMLLISGFFYLSGGIYSFLAPTYYVGISVYILGFPFFMFGYIESEKKQEVR